MKKLLLFPLFFLFCFSLYTNPAEGRTVETVLSPAIDILKETTYMAKGNVCGSAVTFSAEDFSKIYGTTQWESLKISTLPENRYGILQIEGNTVTEDTPIIKEKINSLRFIPTGETVGKTEFRFCFSSSNSDYKCIITMGENNASPQPVKNTAYRTYRNVAVFSEIKVDEGHSITITSPCKNGILSIDKRNGAYVYRPSTNFIGTDEFQYCISDEYGNKSPVSSVKIRTEKAKQNLYFQDLADKTEHKTAIYVCSNGLLPYSTDENGLPIFCEDEVVDRKTFLDAVKKMLPNALIDEASYEYIGEAEAIKILSLAIASEFGKETEVMNLIEPAAMSGTVLTKKRCAVFLEEVALHLANSYFVSAP